MHICRFHFTLSAMVDLINSTLDQCIATWKRNCRLLRYSAKISNIRTIWEKMRTLWPRSFKRTSSLSNSTSLPLLRMSCWDRIIPVAITDLSSPSNTLTQHLQNKYFIKCRNALNQPIQQTNSNRSVAFGPFRITKCCVFYHRNETFFQKPK